MTGTGLMAFWAAIDSEYVLRYQEWHNCEHIPERVAIAGFRLGRRYRLRAERPAFLMMYETDTPEVLASKPYLAALDAPTEWTREALTHFRDPVRNIYRRLVEAGAPGAAPAPWIAALRFNADAAPRDWARGVAGADGVTRARLYAVDEEISNIMTSERGVYGGGPGAQQYLLLVEAARADAARPALEGAPEELRDRFEDHGWLEISHDRKGTIA